MWLVAAWFALAFILGPVVGRAINTRDDDEELT